MSSVPRISRSRQTQLSAWSVILSLLFELADSDAVCSIAGVAGLEIDWNLSTAEAFSHKTRNRAYRPRFETAYKKLNSCDQATVLSIISAELGRRFPQHLETVKSALARVGWTIIIAPNSERTSIGKERAMKRNTELQKLLLLQVRDENEPPKLCQFSEAEKVYNAALLIADHLVEGETIRDIDGNYASAVMTELTSAGHEFLEKDMPSIENSLGTEFPVELTKSLRQFRKDHPDDSKCAFIIMRFGETPAHTSIAQTIRDALESHGVEGLRADDKEYHDDLFWNILTYIHGCGFGIAVFERIEQDEFNPNISLEVGYMLASRKPVLLLKDKTLKSLNTDLMGKLYKVFDPQNIPGSVPLQLKRWLKDKNIVA